MDDVHRANRLLPNSEQDFSSDTIPDRLHQNDKSHRHNNARSQSPLHEKSDISPLRRYSPALISTPVRYSNLEDIREEDNTEEAVKSSHNPPPCTTFTVLPPHTTPPSRGNIVCNPFDAALIKRLHLPIFSPNVFKRVVSPSQDMHQFSWTIEDVAKIRPAPIEEHQTQQYEQKLDPEVELKAQEAIDQYFCSTFIGSSPWEPRPARKESAVFEDGNSFSNRQPPSLGSSDNGQDAVSPEGIYPPIKKEVFTQTVLTLPPHLPPEVEAVLKPYFTYLQDQYDGPEETSLSTSSLRRKLFDQEDEQPMSLSPVRSSCFSMQVECKIESPAHSGLLLTSSRVLCPSIPIIHGRTYGTPLPNSKNVSSPEISPITIQRNRSVTRLNFSSQMMSIDNSARSDSVSPLGLLPIQHEDDEGNKEESTSPKSLDKDTASVSSSSAMITSGTSTPVKEDSDSQRFSVMITSETNTPVRGKFTAFNANVSLERKHSSTFRDRLKEIESCDEITAEEIASFSELGGANMHSQDTGYQTESLSCNITNLHSGGSSGFNSMSVSRNWSNIQFKPLTEKHTNECFYDNKCNLAGKGLSGEDNSLWLPSSKHIISSTPTKSNN